jgi:hypothetical protein
MMEPLRQPPAGDDRAVVQESERLERTSSRAMARMRFAMPWHSTSGRHTDCYVATKLNLWRGLFPPELETQNMDKPELRHVAEDLIERPGNRLTGLRQT